MNEGKDSIQGSNGVPSSVASDETSPLSASIARDFDVIEKSLVSDVQERTKLRKFIRRLREAWTKADKSLDIVLKDPAIASLRSHYPDTTLLLERLHADISRRRAGRGVTLAKMIRDYSAEIHQPCRGRFPSFTVAHFVEVTIDEPAGRTKIGTVSVRSLEWTKIRPMLEREVARVWERPFDAATFRDSLLTIYEELQSRSQSPTGFVLLAEIYRALRSERSRTDARARAGGRLSSYYRDEFSGMERRWHGDRGCSGGERCWFSSPCWWHCP